MTGASTPIGSVENHRRREEGAMVYPVYSRRSGGLSVGINLFPDAKVCSFDCPYCEVFPFKTDIVFSLKTMEGALRRVLAEAAARDRPVRDICFSGNGEPTLSPHFPEALEAAARIRDALVPAAALVLITNGTGLLEDRTFDLLRRAASGPMALSVWLKLDAGTEAWYAQIDRSSLPLTLLTTRIREFTGAAPYTIQTMLCAVQRMPPPVEEARAWEALVLDLAAVNKPPAGVPGNGGAARRGKPGLRKVQIYGKARPSPRDPLTAALPAAFLESRAASLKKALEAADLRDPAGGPIPVEVFP
ncbi:MAG: radical SAM protein [Treponema sp.]|nr:radical SAM protein [Treponema sp.]